MRSRKYPIAFFCLLSVLGWVCIPGSGDDSLEFGTDYGKKGSKEIEKISLETKEYMPTTLNEARGRARILYEAMQGALQVMHRDFFAGDQDLNLPSQSLEDVFKELERTNHVRLHWLVVNGKVMSPDHVSENRFEEKVVALFDKEDKESLEAMQGNTYRFAGRIRIKNSCLKCHVPKRQSLEERAAALVISIPMKEGAKKEEAAPAAGAEKPESP